MKCRICANEKDNRSFSVAEMMFGYGQEFDYFQCAVCHCLQIAAYPPDIEKYYGENYYSYDKSGKRGFIEGWKERLANRYEVFGRGRLGRYYSERGPNVLLRDLSPVLANRKHRILEIGCGSGALLKSLHEIGFRNLTGADPFIDADIRFDKRFAIYKKELGEIEGKFDLIMFHHSLEHLPDQQAIFRQIADRLSTNGTCVVRVPLSSSFAWDEYGVHWVQLDAPRHFYLHSVESLRRLAAGAGMHVSDITYDSKPFQFWGSEQYRRGIPLRDPRSLAECKIADSIFTRDDMAEFRRRADELNATARGDQAVFFIKAPVALP